MTHEKRECACGCGEYLHPHANRRSKYKANHRERARSRANLCQCGKPKTRARGSRYCADCREGMRAEALQRATQARAIKENDQRRAAGIPRRPKPDDEIRRCVNCQQDFPKSGMKPDPKRKSGVSSYCLECHPIVQHAYAIKHSFGIEAEEYYAMLADQGGVCAICGRAPRKQRLAVDHNHKTGEIRGLLCMRCNHKVLGGSGESVDVLRNAADYLENPPARGHRLTTPEITESELERHFTMTEEKSANTRAITGVLVVKRRLHTDPGDWYAITRFADWCHLAKEAGL